MGATRTEHLTAEVALERLYWFYRMVDTGGPDGSELDDLVYEEASAAVTWLSGDLAVEIEFGGRGPGTWWVSVRAEGAHKLDCRVMIGSMQPSPWQAICSALGAWLNAWGPPTPYLGA